MNTDHQYDEMYSTEHSSAACRSLTCNLASLFSKLGSRFQPEGGCQNKCKLQPNETCDGRNVHCGIKNHDNGMYKLVII